MKVHKSVRLSAEDLTGNWMTKETSIELDQSDLGIPADKHVDGRKLAEVLNYEARVFLARNASMSDVELTSEIEKLKADKERIDGFKRELGLAV